MINRALYKLFCRITFSEFNVGLPCRLGLLSDYQEDCIVVGSGEAIVPEAVASVAH